GAVSRDLSHFLSGEPITARPPSPVMKLRYWLKKHPKLLSRSFALAAALVVIGSGSLWIQAERARVKSQASERNEIIARLNEQKAKEQARAAQAMEKKAKENALDALQDALQQSNILKKQQEAQSGDKPAAGERAPK
ncbi:MAG: hypothetical protein KGQ60_17495, partial [Planctomycetes bacterium]|nr:hypothetical protein [Planctomycetota bacterium]